jgi:phosphate transport system substrate-binding protein
MKRKLLCLVAVISCLASGTAWAGEASGAGSTFVAPLLGKWAETFNALTGSHVTYVSIGSGAGIVQIKSGNVTFGASDMPLAPDQLEKAGLGQFPVVIGGGVPVVNIDGIAPGQIKFSGKLLADIYLGKVTNWNDPAIKALNPNLPLPDSDIVVVHRTDGSGTTFNWANFLSIESPEWKQQIGAGTGLAWPIGVGAKGNEGVAASVRQLKNSIGYVEYTYVLQNHLTFGLVLNKAGKFVAPSPTSFQAAAANIDWNAGKNFSAVLTDAPGDDAYPITATTFVLMFKAPRTPEANGIALSFFNWGLSQGQGSAAALGYVPLPATLAARVQAYWKSDFHFGS